jgi:hypothetical protein
MSVSDRTHVFTDDLYTVRDQRFGQWAPVGEECGLAARPICASMRASMEVLRAIVVRMFTLG